MAHLTETRPAHLPFIERLAEMRANLAERIARYRIYRQTLTELSSLSDRDLDDLGIRRADVYSIAMDSSRRV